MTQAELALLRAILHTPPVRPQISRISLRLRPLRTARRYASSPREAHPDPNFVSVVDAPPQIISTRRKTTGWGVALLAVIPVTAFLLGTWQVQRLEWKTNLIAKFEDRLVRPPLPLPPRLDPSEVVNFDYRRVEATGTFLHNKEMLIGPRMHDGNDGYLVVTPLSRGEGASTILVNRGWITKDKRFQQSRDPFALPKGQVTVAGLLREPWKKNFFTPANKPEDGQFYFPDVKQMAEVSGSDSVWVEETMKPDLLASYDREEKGVPIGRAPEVNLRNNHTQYIFTWYSLSAATAIMMWMVLKKKPGSITRRVRQTKEW